MSSKYRRMFADTAYNITKDNVTLDLAASSYDDIIAAITNDNMLYVAIFFFRWCYEDSGNGISNDKIYFDTFVDSKLFDSILNSITNDIEEAESSNVIVNPESNILNDNGSLAFVTYEEVKTMKLLGRIERRTTYYNFFPQYENIDGRFEELPSAVLQEDYPSIGGINLSYTYSGISAQFLGDISTDSYDDEDVNNAYVIEIEADDLEENNNETYKIKLDLQKLVSEGKNLSSVIQCADNYGIYKVVTSEAYPITDKTFINSNVNLFERNIRKGEMVVLEYDGSYYGPFKACYRTIDNKFYVKTGASENNYLVPFYTAEDADIITLQKRSLILKRVLIH